VEISGNPDLPPVMKHNVGLDKTRSFSNRYIGAGKIVKTGSKVTKASIGDHVVLTYTHCGYCKHCLNKDTSFCYTWESDNFGIGRPDGSKSYSSKEDSPITSHFFGQSSFAKHAVVSQNSVVVVDNKMPLKLLAPLGCGIMTGAGGEFLMEEEMN
jgi:aryl-alcohol dehydrogenase